jgi:hypothetical protein
VKGCGGFEKERINGKIEDIGMRGLWFGWFIFHQNIKPSSFGQLTNCIGEEFWESLYKSFKCNLVIYLKGEFLGNRLFDKKINK